MAKDIRAELQNFVDKAKRDGASALRISDLLRRKAFEGVSEADLVEEAKFLLKKDDAGVNIILPEVPLTTTTTTKKPSTRKKEKKEPEDY